MLLRCEDNVGWKRLLNSNSCIYSCSGKSYTRTPLLVFFTNKPGHSNNRCGDFWTQFGLVLYLELNQVVCYMNLENQAKQFADFITVTCLEWKHVLHDDRFKDIIVDSLSFLSNCKRVDIFAFVIMSNHFHLIWQMLGDNRREDVQRDLLKYTSQQIL